MGRRCQHRDSPPRNALRRDSLVLPTRWSVTLSSKVNLPHEIDFRGKFGHVTVEITTPKFLGATPSGHLHLEVPRTHSEGTIRVPFRSKVDRFVPWVQNVNLGIVSQGTLFDVIHWSLAHSGVRTFHWVLHKSCSVAAEPLHRTASPSTRRL